RRRRGGRVRLILNDDRWDGPRAVPDLDVRSAAFAGAGDDVGVPVAVHVTDGDVDAAVELRVVGHEPLKFGAGLAVEHLDERQTAGAGGGDDLRHAVAGDVAGGDADAAAVRLVIGQEAELQLARGGVVDVDDRPVAGLGAGGDERRGDGRRRGRRGRIGGR